MRYLEPMLAAQFPVVLLVLLFGAPWIVPIVYYLYRLRGSDEVFPSAAELIRRRLWPS
jgi:hypothetical protein